MQTCFCSSGRWNAADKLKEAERQAYELDKITKERDSYFAELNANKLERQAVDIANENGVDTDMLRLINFSTIKAEDVEPTIKNFKSIIDKVVEKEVSQRLRETTPKTVVSEMPNTNTEIEQPRLNSKLFRNYN